MKAKYFNPSENASINQYNALQELQYILSNLFSSYDNPIEFTAKEINESGPYPRDISYKHTIANQIDEINQSITFGLNSINVVIWLNDFEIKEIDNSDSYIRHAHKSNYKNVVGFIDEANKEIQAVGYKYFGQEYLDDYKKYVYNKINKEINTIQSKDKNITENDKGLER